MFAPILYSNLFGPSFFSYYISMSVIAQCLVFISVSAFADYGAGRKRFFYRVLSRRLLVHVAHGYHFFIIR